MAGRAFEFWVRTRAGTGAFALADLKPGTYILSFAPASGYAAPAARNIAVAAGQTAMVDTVIVVGNGTPRGTMTWTMGGITYTTMLVSGRIDNQIFSLTGQATTDDATHVVALFIGNGVRTIRTHDNILIYLYSPDSASAGYSNTVNGLTTNYSTRLFITSRNTARYGSGNIIVTRYNASAQTLSGTFDFTAVGDTINPVVISNGRFNLRY